MQDFNDSTSKRDRKFHYEQIKNYFREDVFNKNEYYETSKNNIRQRMTFDLCISLLEDIMQNNVDITKAFDAGCGTGDFTLELANKFLQFRQIVGIDFLQEIVGIAQEKTQQFEKVTFMQGNILNIPFDDRYFDVTICIDVLHHIHSDDFKTAIGELTRITDKYLVIEIRNKKNIFHLWYNHILQPLFFKELPIFTTSIDEVNNLIDEYNFELDVARRIASSRWSCRRLVLVYKRNNNS